MKNRHYLLRGINNEALLNHQRRISPLFGRKSRADSRADSAKKVVTGLDF